MCDGTNNTPDLRERFVVGAGGDNSTVSGTYNVGNTGGANSVTLTVAQIPAHTHTYERTSMWIINIPCCWWCASNNGGAGQYPTQNTMSNRWWTVTRKQTTILCPLCYIMKT